MLAYACFYAQEREGERGREGEREVGGWWWRENFLC